MPAEPIFDIDEIDFDTPLFDLPTIRQRNPQRHEMEQLTAVVSMDTENHSVVGYKDVTDQEFWIAGHMPGFPLMPGVVMCECAAQLCGFYARHVNLLGGDFIGFGGMDKVRFRGPVFPNCRLVIMGRLRRLRANRLAEFDFQGFVDKKMVFSGIMIGVPVERGQKVE